MTKQDLVKSSKFQTWNITCGKKVIVYCGVNRPTIKKVKNTNGLRISYVVLDEYTSYE